jgi:hypothetical protein
MSVKRRFKRNLDRTMMSRVHGLKLTAHNRKLVLSVGKAIHEGLNALVN